MKLKTVCVSIAVATSMATSIIFVPQDQALAQNRSTPTSQSNSKTSKSLKIQWVLGFIPWLTWTSNSNSPRRQNLNNNPNNPIQTNIGGSDNSKARVTKQASNHKEVPVPLLIPGMTALGVSLLRKHRQEQKQMEMELE